MKTKKYKFSDLYIMSSGINTSKGQAGHGSPFISFSTVYGNYFLPDEFTDFMDTTPIEQERFSIKKGDILLTRTSETREELAMSSVSLMDYENITFSGFLKRLRPVNEKVVYHKYIAFYLRSDLFRKTVTNHASLTLRASFNEDIFSFIDIYLPSFEDQVKYGDLLFDLYEKEMQNLKTIKELNASLMLIYNYWFTQFDFPNGNGKPYKSDGGKMVWNEKFKREVPIGWKVEPLKDIAKMYQSQTIPKKDLSDEFKYPVYGAGGIIGHYHTINHVDSMLIISCRGSCGVVDITLPNSWITGNQMVVDACNDYKYYIYGYLSVIDTARLVTGSVQDQITQTSLGSLYIPIPDEISLKKYNDIASSILLKKQILTLENDELRKQRDFLLPLLMNGQVTMR